MKKIIKENKWYILFIILLLVVRFSNGFIINVVEGSSMVPTYQDGDILVGSGWLPINRGDVVVVKTDDIRIVKRLIGLPGDTVESIDNEIYVNGEKINEAYLNVQLRTVDDFSITLGEDEYWVMGDNRDVSKDSRYYGPFDRKDITEKILIKIWG